jgi:hypothetical protein
MSTLTQAAAFATDDAARLPLAAAMVQAAVAIMYEDGATTHHYARVSLAAQVIQHPMAYVEAFAWALSTNATVVDKWTAEDFDGAIGDFPYVVSTVWNAVAGAPAE